MITLISQRTREIGYSKSDCLEQSYVDYFERFGLNLVPVPNSVQNLDFYFSLPVERIILTGGGDIGDEISKERDKTEQALLDFAVKRKIPVLGICRGMQFINHYFGGKLVEIKGKKHISVNHPVDITNERLRELVGSNIETNSYHNFGIESKGLSSKLATFALSRDGLVEGLYHPELPIAGIIWHPERESPDKETNKRIVESFLNREIFWKK